MIDGPSATAMGPFHSRLYGLDIDSAVDLYVRRPPSQTSPDVRIRLGEPTDVPSSAPAGDLQVQWTTPDGLCASFVREPGGDYRLRFDSTCEIVIDESTTQMALQMAPGVSEAMGGVLLAGTALSFLLMVRHEPVLHASAVEVGGSAIAFVGASGMGKTTLATMLCHAGGKLITDDVLRLGRNGKTFDCFLGAMELRLRRTAEGLADSFGAEASHRETADARRALSVPVAERDAIPLSALVVPRPRRDLDDIRLTQLGARDAAVSLLSFPRILGVRSPSLLSQHFLQMTEVAETVPMFIADVPWGPPFAENLPQRLRDHLDLSIDTGRKST